MYTDMHNRSIYSCDCACAVINFIFRLYPFLSKMILIKQIDNLSIAFASLNVTMNNIQADMDLFVAHCSNNSYDHQDVIFFLSACRSNLSSQIH